MPRLQTLFRAVRDVENWPEVVSQKLGLGRRELAILSFRSGLSMVVRRDSRDWDVVRDIFLQSGYGRSLQYLRGISSAAVVIDLGANIGSFSLVAAAQNDRLTIRAYEPGPPNLRLLDINMLANPLLACRIDVVRQAAGGVSRDAHWHFDAANAGASSLFGGGAGTQVRVRSLTEIVSEITAPVALLKIDIEGAEYELARTTPREVWDRIPAVSIEIHRDPETKESKADLVGRFEGLGFRSEPDGRFALLFRK